MPSSLTGAAGLLLRKRSVIVALAAAFCQLASAAWAAEAPPPPPTPGGTTVTPVTPTRRDPIYHHAGQLGVSVMPGIGYGIAVPYEEDVDCGGESASQRVCTSRTPVFLDLQAAFGVTTRLDLVVEFRLGLETLDKAGRQFALMPGLRIWLDQDVNTKFYTTIQGVFDSTNQVDPSIADKDFGFRNANGLMYDVIRNVGFFFQFGETFGFKRWFRIELDVGIGVQVRVP